MLGPAAHDHVLDWWAGALDHLAASRPPSERPQIYQRITIRMSQELEHDPASTPANYWTVAAARGSGDVEGAWSKLIAAWLRAPFTRDRGAALRADLDRLVVQALITERAGKMTGRDLVQMTAALTADWESFKAAWAR
jgi:hypothetical protein